LTQLLATVPDLSPLPAATSTYVARTAGDPDDLLAAVDLLRAQTGLHAWLRRIVDDPDEAARVAAGSYYHANGFAKLVLHADQHLQIRLHVWLPGSGRRGETNPHGHRWDFASTVLAGTGLVITEYAECATDTGREYVRHSYDGAELDPTGAVHLRSTCIYTIPNGDPYVTPSTAVHTVDPLGTSLVATLVVQGASRALTTPVYRVPGAGPAVADRPIAVDDVRTLVGTVLAELDRTGTGER
jgi:hypothetical protein